MSRTLSSLLLTLTLLTGAGTKAQVQQITYSEPEREDGRRTNFEIIGKMNDNYLVFKNNNSNCAVSIYDSAMRLQQRVPLTFMPDRYINIDFVPYADFCYMIYEYQRKGIVHCTAVKLNAQGQKMGDPVDLDTTQISFAANNKIYTTVYSEDKQRIMVFKINSKNPRNFLFTTYLFDADRHKRTRRRQFLRKGYRLGRPHPRRDQDKGG
jgi:hypothetical protein